MGYKDRTIRMDFGDLGKGCFATIKNPALLPLEAYQPVDPNLTEAEAAVAGLARANARVGRLIVEWHLWDVTQDEDVLLPLPSDDPTVMERCPSVVVNAIANEVQRRNNPQQPLGSRTSKS